MMGSLVEILPKMDLILILVLVNKIFLDNQTMILELLRNLSLLRKAISIIQAQINSFQILIPYLLNPSLEQWTSKNKEPSKRTLLK